MTMQFLLGKGRTGVVNF